MGVVKLIKDVVKNFQVSMLMMTRNYVPSITQENYDHQIELLLATSEAEREEIRARFIERINKRNGFPTQSALERANQNISLEQEIKSTDNIVLPKDDACKDAEQGK